MTARLRSLSALLLLGFGIVAGPAQAASGVGPYYAMPAWDQTIATAVRFIVLTNMNSEAVLDRETGLVWERSPSTEPFIWLGMQSFCNNKVVGGRKGWRLPRVQELASLIDPTMTSPALPAGHPFRNIEPYPYYWSANTYDEFSGQSAWVVDFASGQTSTNTKVSFNFAWCVRGGQGPDIQ